VLEGVFIPHWSARRLSAVHPASTIWHRGRLTRAPAACPRERILKAAERLFADRGYEETSVIGGLMRS
jgi:hypothetical protein